MTIESNCPLSVTSYNVLLASNSPRRQELLGMIVPRFDVVKLDNIDECYPADTLVDDVAGYLSRLKANAYKQYLASNEVIVTADTVVIIDDKILGKPHSYNEAVAMLQSLSGRQHRVMTGVTLTSVDKCVSFDETTHVTFDLLSGREIEAYIKNCRPYDKAGSYGIQEWIGAIGISKIDGDYYNVMGLPVNHLYHELLKF